MNDRDDRRNSDDKQRPSYIAYQVRDGEDRDGKEQSFFNRIGAAFEHNDHEGHTIELGALPVDGRVVLRAPKERLDEMRTPEGQQQDGERQARRRDRSRGR